MTSPFLHSRQRTQITSILTPVRLWIRNIHQFLDSMPPTYTTTLLIYVMVNTGHQDAVIHSLFISVQQVHKKTQKTWKTGYLAPKNPNVILAVQKFKFFIFCSPLEELDTGVRLRHDERQQFDHDLSSNKGHVELLSTLVHRSPLLLLFVLTYGFPLAPSFSLPLLLVTLPSRLRLSMLSLRKFHGTPSQALWWSLRPLLGVYSMSFLSIPHHPWSSPLKFSLNLCSGEIGCCCPGDFPMNSASVVKYFDY